MRLNFKEFFMLRELHSFEDIKGLDIQRMMADLNFPVKREPLYLSTGEPTKHEELFIGNGNIGEWDSFGEADSRMPLMPYADTLKWLLPQFKGLASSYKLVESYTYKKTLDVLQEYVFDIKMQTKNGDIFYPSIILRMSYIDPPFLEIYFGEFALKRGRGTIINDGGVKYFLMNIRNWEKMRKQGIKSDLVKYLPRVQRFTYFYDALYDTPLKKSLKKIIDMPILLFSTRKTMLKGLRAKGAVTLSVSSDADFRAIPNNSKLSPYILDIKDGFNMAEVYDMFAEEIIYINSPPKRIYDLRAIFTAFYKIVREDAEGITADMFAE